MLGTREFKMKNLAKSSFSTVHGFASFESFFGLVILGKQANLTSLGLFRGPTQSRHDPSKLFRAQMFLGLKFCLAVHEVCSAFSAASSL